MKLSSPVFTDGAVIPPRYTCEGPNISPPLSVSDVPADAVSMVLTVTDPDAPARPWVHWLVFNIPPSVREIPEAAVPPGGTEGYANGGTPGYEGPCPPTGTHRYVFTLYALDTGLAIPASSDMKAVLAAAEGHILETGVLEGIYTLRSSGV